MARKKTKTENLLNKKSTTKKTVRAKREKKTPLIKVKKVKPLIINDKAYCPICQKREYIILDYGFREPDEHYFKEYCKTCNATFEVKKYINENLEFVLKEDQG